MNNDPYGPMIDARERELADHYRRLWPVIIVLASLGLCGVIWALIVVVSDRIALLSYLIHSASSVFAP